MGEVKKVLPLAPRCPVPRILPVYTQKLKIINLFTNNSELPNTKEVSSMIR